MKIAVLFSVTALSLFLFTLGVQKTGAEECDCGSCHGNNFHGDNWAGCSSCHDTPPQTAPHLKHYGSGPILFMSYGDTTITSTADAYKFGCGNCHPLDNTKHRDGILQVELYNPASPSASLKAKNPSTAAYAPGLNITTYASKVAAEPNFSYSDGSCSNVYCHSGNTATSGPVGLPLESSPGVYLLDADCNLTYDPYFVASLRDYRTTPAWGAGSISTCTACHEFPLTTSYPSNQAGVGDSHQWIDDAGWGNLHAYNMGTAPLSCRACHYGTVTEANGFTRDEYEVTTYEPVPLASHVMHVNGAPDVIFDQTNTIVYDVVRPNVSLNLSGASYDPSAKTCSNVACHYGTSGTRPYQTRYQQTVQWGKPYRWYIEAECETCHRVTYQQSCP